MHCTNAAKCVRSCKHTCRLKMSFKQEILFLTEQWLVCVIKSSVFQLKNNKVLFERINVLYPSKEELLWALYVSSFLPKEGTEILYS